MFFNKSKDAKYKFFKTLPPSVEERDLMRKLSEDILNVLNRHHSLCSDTCPPNVVNSIQINALTRILVHYFLQLYHTTEPIIPYITLFINNLPDTIRHSIKDHS